MNPIDTVLYGFEKIADRKKIMLEDVPGYVELCAFLTDLEFGDQPRRFISEDECLDVLERIAQELHE